MENKSENRNKGSRGERAAAKELYKKGYKILDMNYCRRGGEIDIVAEKDGIIVFVEVKARKNLTMGMPCEAVDIRKQKRIIETAKKYIDEKNLYGKDIRFDVTELLEKDGRLYMRHTENAFWES